MKHNGYQVICEAISSSSYTNDPYVEKIAGHKASKRSAPYFGAAVGGAYGAFFHGILMGKRKTWWGKILRVLYTILGPVIISTLGVALSNKLNNIFKQSEKKKLLQMGPKSFYTEKLIYIDKVINDLNNQIHDIHEYIKNSKDEINDIENDKKEIKRIQKLLSILKNERIKIVSKLNNLKG